MLDRFAQLVLGRVPGSAPGGAIIFRATTSHQRTRALLSATPSPRYGASCVVPFAGCAAERTTRLRRCVQTTAASQLVKLAHTCAPATSQIRRKYLRHRRKPKDLSSSNYGQPWSRAVGQRCRQTAKQPNSDTGHTGHTGHRFAWLGAVGLVKNRGETTASAYSASASSYSFNSYSNSASNPASGTKRRSRSSKRVGPGMAQSRTACRSSPG